MQLGELLMTVGVLVVAVVLLVAMMDVVVFGIQKPRDGILLCLNANMQGGSP
jgi:uncharacterized membrane protein YqiK